MRRSALLLAIALCAIAIPAAAQQVAPPDDGQAPPGTSQLVAPPMDPYAPITPRQRVVWIVDGTIGPQSLATGVVADAWQTAWNVPEEWGRGWSGVGKRYLEREADVAISNTLEAGVGAIWGEDPRYIPAPHGTVKSRLAYALKTVLLAPRPDGHLAPAYGRYVGNTLNNIIENSYLPPSMTTPGQTAWRSASGLLSRAMYNVWEEFWPDVRRHLRH